MDNRAKTATLVLAVQIAITALASGLVFSLIDARAAAAAAIGGGICLITTGFFSLRVFIGVPEWSAEEFLRRFYRAELQKIAVAATLVLGALLGLQLPGWPLMLTFLLALMANWLVLLIST
ncbi:MAG TPA: F0F1 ATP synthase assembly protein I [Gammaproteobacteria bacterium]